MALAHWIENARKRSACCFVCRVIVESYDLKEKLEDVEICGIVIPAREQFWHLEHHVEEEKATTLHSAPVHVTVG